MRKKLDTRFPAARIKKIMQADEDVGKIAMAVPLLVSKALELFLQDLCDRTYDITLQRGAKTMSSLHLKQCVHSFGVFDFLRHIVNKVPDIGHSDASGEERHARKRKGFEGEDNETDDDTKKSKEAAGIGSTAGRGRCRGRGRGRGRPPIKVDDIAATSPAQPKPSSVMVAGNGGGSSAAVRDFDLNENPDGAAAVQITGSGAAAAPISETKEEEEEEYPGWALPNLGKMGIDHVQFAMSKRPVQEEDEDYDNDDDDG